MRNLRLTIRKILLEACRDGQNFDDDTGVPCGPDPQAWANYYNQQAQEQMAQFQDLMNRWSQSSEEVENAQSTVSNSLKQRAKNDDDWKQAWKVWDDLTDEYWEQHTRIHNIVQKKYKELFALARECLPWGKYKNKDYCNRWLAKNELEPVDGPLPMGQLLGRILVGKVDFYQEWYDAKVDGSRNFWQKQYKSVIDNGNISLEKFSEIGIAKIDELIDFEKRFLKALEETLTQFRGFLENTKKEGKGWYVDKDGYQVQSKVKS